MEKPPLDIATAPFWLRNRHDTSARRNVARTSLARFPPSSRPWRLCRRSCSSSLPAPQAAHVGGLEAELTKLCRRRNPRRIRRTERCDRLGGRYEGPEAAQRGDQSRREAAEAALEAMWRADTCQSPHEEAEIGAAGVRAAEWDERVADLHYADRPEYATGHRVSAKWNPENGGCRAIRTAWVGVADVEKTAAADVPELELSMEILGRLGGGLAAGRALGPLVEQYCGWIGARRREVESGSLQGARRETAGQLLDYATVAADRMANGVARLGEDAYLLDAFGVANRAVARGLCRRLREQIRRAGPALVAAPARVPAEPARARRSARPAPRGGRPAVLPDRRGEDRGVPGAGHGGDDTPAPCAIRPTTGRPAPA